MAVFFVGPQAGAGTGTAISPYNLSQADNTGAFGDIFIWLPGTYLTTSTLTVPRRVGWQALDQSNRPIIRANAPFGGTYLVQQGNEGASIDGFILEANGNNAGGFNGNGSRISRCKLTTDGGTCVISETASELEIVHGGSGPAISSNSHIDLCYVRYTSTNNAAVFGVPNVTRCVVVGGSYYPIRSESCRFVIAQGTGRDAFYENSNRLELQNCISWDSREFTTWDTGSYLSVENCFEYSSTNASPATYTDLTNLSSDIFTDFANGDLTLTSYGKTIQGVKDIMANLVGVPGITTDPLADLVGSGGGGGTSYYSPFRSPGVFG